MSSVTETIFPKAEDPALVRERKKTEAAQNAAAVSKALKASIYYDGEKYWSKLPTARWAPDNQQLMASNLRNEYGISKGRDMDNVLFQIRKYRRVVGTFPYIHNRSEIIQEPAGPTLNTAHRQLLQPAAKDGPFPWLKEFFDKIWDPAHPEQKDVFLAWFHRFYRSAYEGQLRSGHAIIIAGDTNLGKTLFSRKIVGATMGGFTDAGSFLLGKTEFNKEAAECAVWAVDDNRGSSTLEKHDEFSDAIKRFVANPQIPYHPKFRDATTVTWRGRIIVTCNLHAKSLSILPDMDGSIRDKLMLFKCADWRPSFVDVEAVIARELPFFLRWLLAWTPEKPLETNERFGIDSWHHPDLLFKSFEDSPAGLLSEMLPRALKHHCRNDEKDTERWMTATDIRALLDNDGLRSGLARFGGNRLGIALSKLVGGQIIKDVRRFKGYQQYLVCLE